MTLRYVNMLCYCYCCTLQMHGNAVADIFLPASVRFSADNEYWIATYAVAYVKMVGTNARYVPGKAIYITGRECPSGWMEREAPHRRGKCGVCGNHKKACPGHCMCATSFHRRRAVKDLALMVSSKLPGHEQWVWVGIECVLTMIRMTGGPIANDHSALSSQFGPAVSLVLGQVAWRGATGARCLLVLNAP
jgi:hypothetical protein